MEFCALGGPDAHGRNCVSWVDESARKWHALAERRRRHYVELYRSERWRRYFGEEAFLLLMRDAIQNVETWAKILERMTGRARRRQGGLTGPEKPINRM